MDLIVLEEKLMKYVLDFVYVVCEFKVSNYNNWKIRNKNVGVVIDENIRVNIWSEYNFYVDELRKDFFFYKNRMIGYLIDNKEFYFFYKCINKKEDINLEK